MTLTNTAQAVHTPISPADGPPSPPKTGNGIDRLDWLTCQLQKGLTGNEVKLLVAMTRDAAKDGTLFSSYTRLARMATLTRSRFFDARKGLVAKACIRQLPPNNHQLTGYDDGWAIDQTVWRERTYISLAVVPSVKFPNLAVDREALLTGLSPSRLTRSRGRGWSAIVRDAEGFKIRYTLAYREHHRRFHDELPVFQSELFTARKKLAALRLLDTIRELSGAPESSLEIDLDSFSPGPVPCSYQGGELDLSVDPQCSECQITLEQSVPSAELAKLAPESTWPWLGRLNCSANSWSRRR